jgi:hypothetical protein
VVAVHVCHEDFHFSVKAASGSYHLSLYAFAAVEHYLLALALYQDGWQASASCWDASSSA